MSDVDWLSKMGSLCFDLLAFAPNSKIAAKKMGEAIWKLLGAKELVNESGKPDGRFVDESNMTIRVALFQFRILKQDLQEREKVLRRLETKDRKRFLLILERMQLPPDCEDIPSDDEEVCYETALVPYVETSDKNPSSHSTNYDGDGDLGAFEQVLAGTIGSKSPATPPQASSTVTPFGTTEKRNVRASVGLKLRAQKTPEKIDPSDEDNGKGSSKDVRPVKKGKSKENNGQGSCKDVPPVKKGKSDEDLLAEALLHIPKVSHGPLKKTPKKTTMSLKRPAGMIDKTSTDYAEGTHEAPMKCPAMSSPATHVSRSHLFCLKYFGSLFCARCLFMYISAIPKCMNYP